MIPLLPVCINSKPIGDPESIYSKKKKMLYVITKFSFKFYALEDLLKLQKGTEYENYMANVNWRKLGYTTKLKLEKQILYCSAMLPPLSLDYFTDFHNLIFSSEEI